MGLVQPIFAKILVQILFGGKTENAEVGRRRSGGGSSYLLLGHKKPTLQFMGPIFL